MKIDLSVDVRATLRAVPVLAKQVSWATAGAINDVAFIARDAERSNVQRSMTIRRPWVLQGIQVARPFATAQNPTVIVEVERKRGFLDKFERGDEKVPRGTHIAVPDEEGFVRSQVIPKGKRPKAFEFKLHTTASGKQQYRGKQRTFILETGSGSGIFQRVGRGKASDMRLLYWFTKRAQIEPILRFERTVREVVAKAYHHRFAERFAAALRTARI